MNKEPNMERKEKAMNQRSKKRNKQGFKKG